MLGIKEKLSVRRPKADNVVPDSPEQDKQQLDRARELYKRSVELDTEHYGLTKFLGNALLLGSYGKRHNQISAYLHEAEGISQEYLADNLTDLQHQAKTEAELAGHVIDAPESGRFEVVNNVSVLPPEK
jgi:hypothetical protein